MRAVVIEKYGGPEVFELKEIEKPTPSDREVLIKVKNASVNPLDRHLSKGILPVRFAMGFFKPKYRVLGADVAGRIESVGKNVSQFEVGDEVFGDILSSGLGAFADYVTAPADL